MEMIWNSSIESSLQYGDEKGKKGNFKKERTKERRTSMRGGGEKKKNGDRSALLLLQ